MNQLRKICSIYSHLQSLTFNTAAPNCVYAIETANTLNRYGQASDEMTVTAPYRPFNLNRFLYHWHWFWDTGTADMGNNGIYKMDTARWALNKYTHPVKIHCTGGLFGRDPKEQETPNIMDATYVYEDGTIIQNEVRGLPTNPEGVPEDSGVCFVYGDKGWMSIEPHGYKTYFGAENEPGPAKSDSDFQPEERSNGWKNLVDCVRSGRKEDLDNP